MTKRSRLAGPAIKPFNSRTQKVSERWPFECPIVRLSDLFCIFQLLVKSTSGVEKNTAKFYSRKCFLKKIKIFGAASC
jgi:hypothetical protein